MKSNRLFALLAGLGFVVGIQAQNPIDYNRAIYSRPYGESL